MKIPFLNQIILFRGISPKEIEDIIPKLKLHTMQYQAGDVIYRTGDKIKEIGIVVSGKLQIETTDLWDGHTILDRIQPKMMFGSTYAFIPEEAIMVDIKASEDSVVVFFEAKNLFHVADHYPLLLLNLFQLTAQVNLDLSRRIYHTSHKTIRGRLRAYLSYEAKRHNSPTFHIPFDRQQLADYLNVDRSALSNELSKMQKEGLLSVHKNHFTFMLEDIEQEQ